MKPLAPLLPKLRTDPGLEVALPQMSEPGEGILVCPKGLRPAVIALARESRKSPEKGPVVVVTASGRKAEQLATSLGAWTGGVEVFPSWETLPHERLSPQVDTMARRAAVLRRLAKPDPTAQGGGPISVLVVPLRAFMQPIIGGLADIAPAVAKAGDDLDRDELVDNLVSLGYSPVDLVESRGQVAVRGGIVDVFVPTAPHPLRVEFFGDQVDEVRWFNVADQRTTEIADAGLWAPPARELLLTSQIREKALEVGRQYPAAAELLELASEGIYAPGLESLSPLLVNGMASLTSLLPPGTLYFLDESEEVRTRSADLITTAEEFLQAAWGSAADGGKAPIDLKEGSFVPLEQLWGTPGGTWWSLTTLPPPALAEAEEQAFEGSEQLDLPAAGAPSPARIVSPTLVQVGSREVRPYRGNLERASADLAQLSSAGWEVVVTVPAQGAGRRIVAVLGEADVAAKLVEKAGEAPSSVISVLVANAANGFVMTGLKLAVLTEADLTGRVGSSTKDMRKMPSKRRARIDPLTLHPGDYIVHEQHGIGKFVEMTTRSTLDANGVQVQRDYLVVEYLPSRKGQAPDRLYVPTSSLDQVSRYTGSDTPRLSKMGGTDWAKAKQKARKAVREIAAELVRLYAARTATKGYAFPPDTPWQRELEDAFEFVETPDQLATMDEVKADMEASIPMDRLLTGDVGYGKTEIAVRAAFKAVQDGKQVAVLVPTTLLAEQHYDTFSERYAGFPVTVATLSRFSTKKEAARVKEGLADGSIDVVIGTHTLLTGSIQFKDLGLVVVDEEQRFGVEHKETLKALRTDVDVLSMSATPIPRTLEMAVAGIREMSVLQTPPEERQPVLTYVGAHQDAQVAAAIRREMLRDGQVFYVHNRVESINGVAAHLQELVPDARIRVAHGKLSEAELERVIVDFWNHEFDVLVSTTIIETGLDISNANTLIVDRADAFGLSQLHQLRGRVGRGAERAYAYFFYRPDKVLSETAIERLRTIATNSDLGAGLAVAQKDLEIRGAGNLLGGAQSGHIDGVGFDLYVRMVSEAVAAFKGEGTKDTGDVRVEIAVDAHIPENYISGERLRLETYGRIAAIANDQEEHELAEELIDRYGPVPNEVDLLLEVARLRRKLRGRGIRELITQGNYLRIAPIQLKESQAMRLQRLYPGSVIKPAVRQVLVPLSRPGRLAEPVPEGRDLLQWIDRLLDGALKVG